MSFQKGHEREKEGAELQSSKTFASLAEFLAPPFHPTCNQNPIPLHSSQPRKVFLAPTPTDAAGGGGGEK